MVAGLARPLSFGAAMKPKEEASPSEPVASFTRLRDWLRYAVSRFNEAGLAYGHGATNSFDEAAFIVLEALHLPIDRLDPFLDARLTLAERERLNDLIERRIGERKPAAYLLNRAYIQGERFYVDERVIVPRSFIGELLLGDLAGAGGIIESPDEVAHVLDLCTGGGSLAILAARVFPNALIDAVDLSADALDVARRNVDEHHLADRIALHQGDLFAPLAKKRFDLILSNPPYVDSAALADFPPEYSAEPRLAHDGGDDGLTLVRRIVLEAREYLAEEGALICEVGRGGKLVETAFPDVAMLWLDTEESQGEVFLAWARDLPFLKSARAGRRK
jgi:ribosomal protein L3 glutamine methyltransferase